MPVYGWKYCKSLTFPETVSPSFDQKVYFAQLICYKSHFPADYTVRFLPQRSSRAVPVCCCCKYCKSLMFPKTVSSSFDQKVSFSLLQMLQDCHFCNDGGLKFSAVISWNMDGDPAANTAQMKLSPNGQRCQDLVDVYDIHFHSVVKKGAKNARKMYPGTSHFDLKGSWSKNASWLENAKYLQIFVLRLHFVVLSIFMQ